MSKYGLNTTMKYGEVYEKQSFDQAGLTKEEFESMMCVYWGEVIIKNKEDTTVLKLDSCTVDFSRAEVNKGGKLLPLTAMEHRLLETLAKNEGRIVTVDTLCEALWGDNPFGYENSLNAHVRRVREKIEADPSKPVSLLTVKGLGYKLLARK